MIRLPEWLRPRTQVRTDAEKDALDRLAEAYRSVFVLPTGDVTPHGAIVLHDLAKTCMFAREDLPINGEAAIVRATLNAVYSRILRLSSLHENDVIVARRKIEND
jgi:hypothetical protein